MKTLLPALSAIAALLFVSANATADTFNDAAGDFTGGNSDLDIGSVTVNNDATTLTFTITLAGNPVAQNWYNFYVGIAKDSLSSAGGDFNATGGYGKDIQMSQGGMDYVLAGYPFFSGYDLKTWNGTSWDQATGTATATGSTVTIPVALSSLGLSAGDGIHFDVWTSDTGSDTVLDALSDSTSRTWNSNPFDTGANALAFTVTAVPEPATLVLFGLGALAALGVVRRRRGCEI